MSNQNKIVFLDIDGVLNKAASVEASAEAIEQVNRIIDATDCSFVLSTSWRLTFPYEMLTDTLESVGIKNFKSRCLGVTPDHSFWSADDGQNIWPPRGNEIWEWLVKNKKENATFVILDDCDDMSNVSHRLVQTEFKHGLTSKEADKAIRLLNENEK